MASAYIIREGRRWSPAMWACVQEWRRLATAVGIPFQITQGGFNKGGVLASAGTHDGDAIDVSVSGLSEQQVGSLIRLARSVGLAAWFRTTKTRKWGTRAQGFASYHIHAVPNGWGLPSSGARSQATSYRSGRDGLATNQADLGPGHVGTYRTRTWPQYLALRGSGLPGSGVDNTPSKPNPAPQEDDMTPEQDKLLRDIATQVLGRDGREDVGAVAARHIWSGTRVNRGSGSVAAIQELADTKSGVMRLEGQIAGLTSALKSMAAGQGVDLAAVEAAAKRGAESALKGSTVKIELGG